VGHRYGQDRGDGIFCRRKLAGLAAMRFDYGKPEAVDPVDREGCRPAFQVLMYPGNSGRLEVVKDAPPLFIVGGYKDRKDISEGVAKVYLKYKERGYLLSCIFIPVSVMALVYGLPIKVGSGLARAVDGLVVGYGHSEERGRPGDIIYRSRKLTVCKISPGGKKAVLPPKSMRGRILLILKF